MKYTFLSKENSEAKFTMEFSAEEFDDAQIRAYKTRKGSFPVDGFRKGKAPRSIIEKHYGEGVFMEAAVEMLFSENYPKAIDELLLEIVDSPAAQFGKIAKGEPLTITITVPIFPEIEVKDYKGVEIEKVTDEVSDEEVEAEINALRKRNASMVSVDREAHDGDIVLFDYAGFVGEEQFEGGTAENQTLTLGSGSFIPGFEEQLIGVKAGEKRDVKVTFPEEYHAEDLAGKDAVFHCTVHEVKEEQIPEADDDFAMDVSEYDTIDELKKATREKLESYAKEEAETKMKDAILSKVVDANEVTDIPRSLLDDEMKRYTADLDQQLRYRGMTLEQYIQFTQKDIGEFVKELMPQVEKTVKTGIVLRGVALAENIDVTKEEIDKEIETVAVKYKMEEDHVRALYGGGRMAAFVRDIQNRKVIDYLYNEAKIK